MPPVPVCPSPRRPGQHLHCIGTNSEHYAGRRGGNSRPRFRERGGHRMWTLPPPVAGLIGRRQHTGPCQWPESVQHANQSRPTHRKPRPRATATRALSGGLCPPRLFK